jgi:hypothetical protein
VFKGTTRELGRATCLPARTPEERGYWLTKSLGAVSSFQLDGEPEKEHKEKEAGQGIGERK